MINLGELKGNKFWDTLQILDKLGNKIFDRTIITIKKVELIKEFIK